jgi:hypothetical protein
MPQVCTKCREKKPSHNFNRDKTKADGLQFRCKVGETLPAASTRTVNAAFDMCPARLGRSQTLHSERQLRTAWS